MVEQNPFKEIIEAFNGWGKITPNEDNELSFERQLITTNLKIRASLKQNKDGWTLCDDTLIPRYFAVNKSRLYFTPSSTGIDEDLIARFRLPEKIKNQLASSLIYIEHNSFAVKAIPQKTIPSAERVRTYFRLLEMLLNFYRSECEKIKEQKFNLWSFLYKIGFPLSKPTIDFAIQNHLKKQFAPFLEIEKTLSEKCPTTNFSIKETLLEEYGIETGNYVITIEWINGPTRPELERILKDAKNEKYLTYRYLSEDKALEVVEGVKEKILPKTFTITANRTQQDAGHSYTLTGYKASPLANERECKIFQSGPEEDSQEES